MTQPFNHRRRTLLKGTATLALSAPFSTTLAEESYPSRSVTVISPFPAGGSGDIITRFYARHLSESLKQTFVVENRPGANGMIGMTAAARAKPDGYTLLHTYDGSFSVAPAVSEIPVEPLQDYTPLGMMGQLSMILAAHPSFPANTMQEAVDEIRRRPNAIDYASAGAGSSLHILMEMFLKQIGGSMTMIPFSGTAPAVNAVLGGHVPMTLCGILTALPHIRAGKMKVYGFAGDERHPSLPDVPTFKESGIDFKARVWQGLFAPAGIPADIAQTLSDRIWKISTSKLFLEEFAMPNGYDPTIIPPDRFPAFLREDRQRYEAAVAALNLAKIAQ